MRNIIGWRCPPAERNPHPDAPVLELPWTMDSHCRVGVVRYLNTLPLVEGLEKLDGVVLCPAPPADLADMLRRGDVDIALVSVVDAMGYSTDDSGLTLLPVGMIACDGPTMTVRLVSRVPMGEMTTLTADDESRTSVVLARVILRECFSCDPSIDPRRASGWLEDPGARREVESALLIGDKVIAAPPLDDFPYHMDLGERWHALTGLPFVYAMWACRSREVGSERIGRAASLLDRQRRRNAHRLGWLVGERAGAFGWPADLAMRYVTELLRYEVDERAIAGLLEFARRCSSLGLGTAPRLACEWMAEADPRLG